MSPRKALTEADTALRPGQLTTRGFMQHIELGQLLNKIYGKNYLADIVSSQMYVRTTNYARTVQVTFSVCLCNLNAHFNCINYLSVRERFNYWNDAASA